MGPPIDELNRQRGIQVSEETCLPGWGGEPGDLKYVADIYLINRHVSLKQNGKVPPEGPDP